MATTTTTTKSVLDIALEKRPAGSCDVRPRFAQSHWVEIRRTDWGPEGTALVDQCITEAKPCILGNSRVVQWEKYNKDRYATKMLSGREVGVKISPNARFRYWNLEKNKGYAFTPPTRSVKMSYEEFELRLAGNAGQDPIPGSRDATDQERVYMQEGLSGHEELAQEFASWDWNWLLERGRRAKWGPPNDCQLWIGSLGAESPLHFDEGENMFVQLRGRKRVVLFPTSDYLNCYPFPVGHPCDRHSMVNVPSYDSSLFPRFASAQGHYAVLQPGDCLYIPYGWWHYLRNEDTAATSISFWSNTQSLEPFRNGKVCLDERLLVRVRRNLERIVVDWVAAQGGAPGDVLPGLLMAVRCPESLTASATKEAQDIVKAMLGLLEAVRIPEEERRGFLVDTLATRYEVEWDRFV